MAHELTEEAASFSMAEAEAALADALRFGVCPSLGGIRALTEALGRPQDSFVAVQVTGTNGKTSVTRLTSAILAAQGWRTGAYTSPHLRSYAERVEVPGMDASGPFARAVGMAVTTARDEGLAELTEFELLTGAALWLFADLGVEIAVLEVGLGGRWDATSVTDPAVAVVTGVGLDHTDRLGATVEEIAFDKAHVIKPASVSVLGPGVGFDTAPYFLARAEEVGARTRAVVGVGETSPVPDELTVRFRVAQHPSAPGGATRFTALGMYGHYTDLVVRGPSFQAANATTAVAAAEAAAGRALESHALRRALAEATFPGRFELLDAGPPPLVADGAHNPQAAATLAGAVAEAWPDPASRPVFVLGMLGDKDAAGVAAALAPVAAGFVATAPETPRALPAGELAAAIEAATGVAPSVVPGVAAAIAAARRDAPAGVVVTGSLYTAGEAAGAL